MSGTRFKLNDFLRPLICVIAVLLPPSIGHADAMRGGIVQLSPLAARFSGEPCIHPATHILADQAALLLRVDFKPESWQEWALLLLLVAAACFALALSWRWRQRDLLRQKHRLEIAVQRRTEELETEKAELLRAREQMRHYAERDGLTGLWNRRIIIDRLRREVDRSLRNGTPISIILTDLDRFKGINDTFGHPGGDTVLRWIGKILMRSVRSYDWVGRYGGEEFLIILPGATLEHARARADELRKSIESALIPDGDRAIQVTASFGAVSGLPSDYESLLRAADAALYRAKHSGRNCVVAVEIDSSQPF